MNYPRTPIVVAYAFSDFHYLRMAYPGAPVYKAHTTPSFGPFSHTPNVPRWVAEQHRWYGNRYIGDMAALDQLYPQPCLFVCWKTDGWDPRGFSWIWGDPRLRLTLLFKYERYEVYQVGRV